MKRNFGSLAGHTWSRKNWYAEVNFWPISRPHFAADWCDPRQFFVALSWGTPGCDPVWMVEYRRVISERHGRMWDRWYARR